MLTVRNKVHFKNEIFIIHWFVQFGVVHVLQQKVIFHGLTDQFLADSVIDVNGVYICLVLASKDNSKQNQL